MTTAGQDYSPTEAELAALQAEVQAIRERESAESPT